MPRRNLIRTYSLVVGIAFVLLGLAGLMTDLVGWDPPANIFHLFVGVTFVCLGFFLRDAETVRLMVGGIGALLVAGKAIIIMIPLLLGRVSFHSPIEVTCLIIGLLSVLAARYLRDGEPTQR